MNVVNVFESQDKKYRVEIFKRQNGTYGFQELKWWDDPNYLCWLPVGHSNCIVPSLKDAIREAKSRVAWLKVIEN